MTQSKTPNLKVIAEPGSSPEERRRVPRISVTSEQFRHSESGKVFSVFDLSSEGMALKVIEPEDLTRFTLGNVVEGTLKLRSGKHPVRARVRRVGPTLVGCQFEELEAATRQALKDSFDPAKLGSELKALPAEGEDGSLWYHGPSGTDLMLWRSMDGSYHRFALFVMGSFIQWNEKDGVATGRIKGSAETGEAQNIMRLETLLLAPDHRPDPGKLTVAKTLILSSNLPQELKKWCARQLGA